MKVYDKLVKPIKEVRYLQAENVDRYRLIMRYFFLEYEKIHYWLHKEDVYNEIHQLPGYEDYTLDLCQQDLKQLVEWGNLTANQDSNKVKTIEDFKNKQYRYQLSEYSVEIERLTLKLENLEIEGASLEPTLLERIYQQLLQTPQMKYKEDQEIHGWMNMLMNDFIRLNQNYQDYIKTLNSAKAEELMKTTEFLLYKDKIIMYLRTFVIVMQEKGTLIASVLKEINQEELDFLFFFFSHYELSILRLGFDLSYEVVFQNFREKWFNLYQWFVGHDGVNEVEHLYDLSNEIIRKMTRYAQQIAEMLNRGSNRKEQYIHIGELFKECRDINEAHNMASYVFGVEGMLHLKYISPRTSDDIDQGVYQEKSTHLKFDGHSKIVRKKTIRQPAKDYSVEKKLERLKIEKQLEKQMNKINELIVDNKIDFKDLPKLDSFSRKTLLNWLSKALGQEDKTSKTDDGRIYYLDLKYKDELCTLHSDDGDFIMPHFVINFKETDHE